MMFADLAWFVLGLFALTTVVMWLLLVWAAHREPGSFDDHLPLDTREPKRWITIGGLIIPAIAFGVVLVVSLRVAAMAHAAHHAEPDIRIVGHRWWWEVQYLERGIPMATTANELHVPVHRPVVIEVRSADVIHSFWVPELHGKLDLIPNHPAQLVVHAMQPAVLTGQCAEYCGVQHANMRLVAIAEPLDAYLAYRAHETADAAPPVTDKTRHGKAVFEAKACALCHSIRGTRAHGRVGPDLTHLASRHGLAAMSQPLAKGFVAGWATRAQTLKPGCEMPNQTSLTGDELDALATYLLSLK